MIKRRYTDNEYVQIKGSLEWLRKEPSNKYDYIICHNVMEYMDNRSELMEELARVLNLNGLISIVKHNKMGKVMQKAVFEYNIEKTELLLKNQNVESPSFGIIKEYDINAIKSVPKWLDNMLKIELQASDNLPLREIFFFHHIIMKSK